MNQFILIGSKSPKLNSTNHSGTMRIARINMTTLSLYEESLQMNGHKAYCNCGEYQITSHSYYSYKDGHKCRNCGFFSNGFVITSN